MYIRSLILVAILIPTGCEFDTNSNQPMSGIGTKQSKQIYQKSAEASITLSPEAAKQVNRIMSENGLVSNTHLRVSVIQDGPTGFQYSLGFDDNPNPDKDIITTSRGVKLLIDIQSLPLLIDTEIGFETDGPDGTGFRFHNPNAVD